MRVSVFFLPLFLLPLLLLAPVADAQCTVVDVDEALSMQAAFMFCNVGGVVCGFDAAGQCHVLTSRSIAIFSASSLQRVSFPALTTMSGTTSTIQLTSNAALVSVSFPRLQSINSVDVSSTSVSTIRIVDNPALQNVSFGALTTLQGGGGGTIRVSGNPALRTFETPRLSSSTSSAAFTIDVTNTSTACVDIHALPSSGLAVRGSANRIAGPASARVLTQLADADYTRSGGIVVSNAQCCNLPCLANAVSAAFVLLVVCIMNVLLH